MRVMLHASFIPVREEVKCNLQKGPTLNFPFFPYSFHALYTIRAPYVCPFFSSVWAFHSGTLSALT